MSIDKRRTDLNDDRLRAAVAFGFDLTSEKVAEFAGVSLSSVNRWKTDPEIKSVSGAVNACLSLWRSLRVKESSASVLENRQERVARIFDRALTQTERALSKIENQDDPKFAELIYAHQNITMWATKFLMSEAPKRLKYEGEIEHKFKAVISLAEAQNIAYTVKQIDSSMEPKLIAGAPDVIDLTPA